MNREQAAGIIDDLRARAARIRETNSSKAEDVAAVMEAIVAFTDADRDEEEELAPLAPVPPVTPITTDSAADATPPAPPESAL